MHKFITLSGIMLFIPAYGIPPAPREGFPIEITIPHSTSNQIIRVATAVSGLVVLMYGILISEEKKEEYVKVGVGALLLGLGTAFPRPQSTTPEGINELV